MIVKRKSKYQVRSKKGKLLGTYRSRKQAAKRIAQIEFWKRKH